MYIQTTSLYINHSKLILFTYVSKKGTSLKVKKMGLFTITKHPKNIITLFVTDKILATLGEGTFGKVVKVKELNT